MLLNLLMTLLTELSALKVSSIMMKSSIKKIEEKLESPDCKKNIQMVTHNILQRNDIARTHLKEASRHLDDAVDRLRQTIIDNTKKKLKHLKKFSS